MWGGEGVRVVHEREWGGGGEYREAACSLQPGQLQSHAVGGEGGGASSGWGGGRASIEYARQCLPSSLLMPMCAWG